VSDNHILSLVNKFGKKISLVPWLTDAAVEKSEANIHVYQDKNQYEASITEEFADGHFTFTGVNQGQYLRIWKRSWEQQRYGSYSRL
jgi:hypothetical protein